MKILLAEDNPVYQKVAKYAIKRLGFECDVAENGELAYEMHLKNSYDLILMDIQMPVLDGIETTRKIRSWEEQHLVPVPVTIVAVTANAIFDKKLHYTNLGINQCVSKPVDSAELKKLLSWITSKGNW